MSFTEIFDLSFELLKKNFLLIFGVVFVLYSIPAFAPRWLFPELFVFPPKQGVDPTPQLWLHGYSIIVTGLVSFVSSFIAFVLFDAMTEERIDLRSSFRSSIEVLPSLIWTLFICFLCFIGVCLAFGLWCAFVLFLVSVLSPLGPEMFLILLLVGLFLGAFFVIPRLVFLPQLVAIERISGFAAVRRAWSLTKGSVLHMAGIFLCIWLVTALVPGIFLLTLGPHTPAPVQLVTTLVMTVTTAFSIKATPQRNSPTASIKLGNDPVFRSRPDRHDIDSTSRQRFFPSRDVFSALQATSNDAGFGLAGAREAENVCLVGGGVLCL